MRSLTARVMRVGNCLLGTVLILTQSLSPSFHLLSLLWPQGEMCRSFVLRPGIEHVPPCSVSGGLHQCTRISSRESCFTCRRIKCAPRAELAHPDSTALGETLVHLEAGSWAHSCRGGWEGWAAVWPWCSAAAPARFRLENVEVGDGTWPR